MARTWLVITAWIVWLAILAICDPSLAQREDGDGRNNVTSSSTTITEGRRLDHGHRNRQSRVWLADIVLEVARADVREGRRRQNREGQQGVVVAG